MSAPVRIESEAWDDLRFATLARVLGLADAHHALIKVARLWSWQAEHYTPEAPTYVVDADTIDSALERAGGAAAMVRARLAEEVPEGFRICGTMGRIEGWRRASPTPTLTITYAVEAVGTNLVKIGRTADISRRISELQTASPNALDLFGTTLTDVEKMLHANLDVAGKRVRGEWFVLDMETVDVLEAHGIRKGRS